MNVVTANVVVVVVIVVVMLRDDVKSDGF